jgi:hypothetical protein
MTVNEGLAMTVNEGLAMTDKNEGCFTVRIKAKGLW